MVIRLLASQVIKRNPRKGALLAKTTAHKLYFKTGVKHAAQGPEPACRKGPIRPTLWFCREQNKRNIVIRLSGPFMLHESATSDFR